MSSDAYALALGCALVVYTVMMLAARRSLGAVVLLHNAAWAAALLIIGTGPLAYAPTSALGWAIMTSAILAFNVGAVVGWVGGRKRRPEVAKPAPSAGPTRIPLFAYWCLLGLFTMGVVVYLVAMSRLYGLDVLLEDPAAVRGSTSVSYLKEFPLYGKVLFYLGPLCFVLTVFPSLVERLPQTPVLVRVVILGYLVLSQLATLQRSNLFYALLWAVGVAVLLGLHGSPVAPKVRLARVAGLIGLAGASFQAIALFLGKTATADPAIRYAVSPGMRDSPWVTVLHYASSGVPAFGRLVESDNPLWPAEGHATTIFGDYNPQTWGAATFSTLAKLIPGVRPWDSVAPFTRLPAPTNVYTWLEWWYRDFRLPGVLIAALLVGLVLSRVVRDRSSSTTGLLFGGFLLGMTSLAAFGDRLFILQSLVGMAALAVLSYVARRPEVLALRRRGAGKAADRERPGSGRRPGQASAPPVPRPSRTAGRGRVLRQLHTTQPRRRGRTPSPAGGR